MGICPSSLRLFYFFPLPIGRVCPCSVRLPVSTPISCGCPSLVWFLDCCQASNLRPQLCLPSLCVHASFSFLTKGPVFRHQCRRIYFFFNLFLPLALDLGDFLRRDLLGFLSKLLLPVLFLFLCTAVVVIPNTFSLGPCFLGSRIRPVLFRNITTSFLE